MVLATSGSIRGALTAPRAEGLMWDLLRHGWSSLKFLQHGKTPKNQRGAKSQWLKSLLPTNCNHTPLSLSVSLPLTSSSPCSLLRTELWASRFLSLLVCRLPLLPEWADETLFLMATRDFGEESESICELALHKSR